jgi:hypothetical protein
LAKWVLRKLLFKSGEHRRESFVNGQKKSDNPEQLQLGLLLDGASANVKRGSSVRLVSFRKRYEKS